MPSNLNLDYYYGTEADQYSFYRIPKTLLTDPRYRSVSIEAKVLYGLLLDRMSLLGKNSWMNIKKRICIYFTLENVMYMMDCGHNKAVRLFTELDSTGLIERVKQGQGRPTRIYVKNFILSPFPAPALHITQASGEAGTIRPVLEDETVTYTGALQRYHGADGMEGIASVALTYAGADGVESTTPRPVTCPTAVRLSPARLSMSGWWMMAPATPAPWL